MKNQESQQHYECARWSNRILIVSLIGIGCLTLFPFHFSSVGRPALHGSPFLLGTTGKNAPFTDFLLNVLLFVPFGFGLAVQGCKRGGRRWTTLSLALAAGAIVSYTVELLQFYIPMRNSGWDDIPHNTLGAVIGCVLFELCGVAVLRLASNVEDIFEGWLSPRRAAVLLVAYVGIWAGVSIPLQRETRLSNWDPQCVLFVGNDASGEHPWKGQVFSLQIWNRALPEKLIHQMIDGATVPMNDESSLVASYDFFSSQSPPFLSQGNRVPALAEVFVPSGTMTTRMAWRSRNPAKDAFELNGDSWLSTKIPADKLTQEIKNANQFTIRFAGTPEGAEGAGGRIVSLSQSADNVNFHLRQEGSNLALWFRNPLSETRSLLVWMVPDVFHAGQFRDIVASYDGSDAFLSINGKSVPDSYRLNPGASLEHRFSYIQTEELEGFAIVYEMLIFIPAGLLIGMAARKWNAWERFEKLLVVIGLILPPVLIELLLVAVSGRGILPGNILLSLFFGIAGVALINADRSRVIE